MPRPTSIALTLLLTLPAATTAAPAATYYVAPGGDDGADGLTPETAWATLQHAADTVTAGDTAIALPGTYAGFNLFTSGTPSAPITFSANPGIPAVNPDVVIDRPNGFTGVDGVNLEGASHVVVHGFTLLGTGDPAIRRAGVRVVGFADERVAGVAVRFNRVDRAGRWGIFSGFADDLAIEGNETSRSGDEHGIYVSNSGDRPLIRANLVWGNHANGIHMNGDASLGGDGVISGAVVEGNVVLGNGAGGGSGINCDGVTDSTFSNNLIHDQHASGISLYRIDGGAPSSGNLVANNTVLVAADGRWAMNVQDASAGNTLVNNVFLSAHPDRGSIDLCAGCLPGTVSDHNVVEDRFSFRDVWIDLEEWRAETDLDPASRIAGRDELFVDADGDDYRLAASSPALDSGRADGAPAAGLLGVPRPQGEAVDVGAYERAAALLVLPPEPGIAGLENRLVAHGAVPGAPLRVAGGLADGATPVPGCPGAELAIADPRLLGGGAADAGGSLAVTVAVPAEGEGRRALFQAVDAERCILAEVVETVFAGR